MKRSGSPMILFKNLDLSPLHSILWKGLHWEGPGRPVKYDPECDLRALMLRQLEQIPYMKDLVKRLNRNPFLRKACGYGRAVPTEAHFSQMKKRIGVEGFRSIEAWLRREALRLRESQPLSAVGLVQAACMDGTDLPAWSSRDPHDTSRGLGDRDARVGRGKKGFILGYQSLFLVDVEGLPLGHVEASVNVNEKRLVKPLLDRLLGEDMEVELAVGDSQFESRRVFDVLEARKIGNVIAWRRLKGRKNPTNVLTVKDRIDVEGPEHLRVIYKGLRAKAESLNGRVKTRLAYSRLTWQGLRNASIHVCLVCCVVYAVAIVASLLGRPELRYSIAYSA
ncbi:transposase [Candidatus Bathyarchaeota archaeon]|nr:transposase [Candidatus Bathyarchaeota archaeon]